MRDCKMNVLLLPVRFQPNEGYNNNNKKRGEINSSVRVVSNAPWNLF